MSDGVKILQDLELAQKQNAKFIFLRTRFGETVMCSAADIDKNLTDNQVSCSGPAMHIIGKGETRVDRKFKRKLTDIEEVRIVNDDLEED